MRWENNSTIRRCEIGDIVNALRQGELTPARERIAGAMTLDMDAPEPHNLLGILYELLGDYQAARKHYRAAYALDPTYTPCCHNLERITGFDFASRITAVDFGDGRYAKDVDVGSDRSHD